MKHYYFSSGSSAESTKILHIRKSALGLQLIFVFIAVLLFSQASNAQCTTGNLYPDETFTPTCNGVASAIATDAFAAEYSNVNVTVNQTYVFSSSVTTDYVTITSGTGTILASGPQPLTYIATATQIVRYYLHLNATCGVEDDGRTKSVKCSAPVCSNASALTASNISSNSFQVNWTGYSDAFQIYVTQGTNTPVNPTIETQQGIFGNGWVVNQGITPMYEATTYRVWVRGTCNGTTYPWVGPLLVTTNALPPNYCNSATYGLYPLATYTPGCTGVQETIVADAYASEFSKVTIYSNIQYTFSSSNNADYISITNEAGTAVYAYGATPLVWNSGAISGVVRYHTYANNSCGAQGINRTRFISCTQPVCSVPANLSANTFTPTGATLHYTVATTPGSGFDYYISTTNSAPAAGTTPTGNTTSLNPAVSGLASSTVYFYWVRSNCGPFKSAWVPGGSFTTAAAPPPCELPWLLDTRNITSNSATIDWSPGSSAVVTYDVLISTTNGTPTASTTPSGNTENFSVIASPLSPATTYYYWVRTHCPASNSNWVAGGSFTTQPVSGCNGAIYGKFGADFFPNCNGTPQVVATNFAAGLFTDVTILTNKQYTFSSSIGSDYFTVTNSNGSAVLGSGQSPYTWFSGINTGTIRIFLHSNAACGNSTTNRSVSLSCQNALANGTFDNQGFEVYPNPVTDILNLSYHKTISDIAVFNLLGQKMMEKNINAAESRIDMSTLPSGTYLIKIASGNEHSILKIVKQ